MTDSITKCIKYTKSDNIIDRYEVTFSFPDLDLTPDMITVVVISASELTNTTDMSELKTKACARALQLKNMYAYELDLSSSTITSINGPVNL